MSDPSQDFANSFQSESTAFFAKLPKAKARKTSRPTKARAVLDGEDTTTRTVLDGVPAAGGTGTAPAVPVYAGGAQGLSAYQIALAAGFVGTEAEWLALLVGKSQYQSYLDTTTDDPVLTEEEWSAASGGGSSAFADLTDIAIARAAAAWLRLNTDGTTSQRTAAETLADIGAAPSSGTALGLTVGGASTAAYATTAGAANTLATPRTIFGELFNGSANIGQDLRTTASPTFAGETLTGNLLFSADDVHNIGSSAANRPRRIWSVFAMDSGYITASAQFHLNSNSGRIIIGSSVDLAIARNGVGIGEINNGTAGQYRDLLTRNQTLSGTFTVTGKSTLTGGAQLGASTVATLPTASTNAYLALCVTDASAPALGATVVGGGIAKATVRSNGTAWIVTEIL